MPKRTREKVDIYDRIIPIVDALTTAAEERGHTILENSRNIVIDGETIKWSLYERSVQRKAPLSAKELQDWLTPAHVRERGWKPVLEPSGYLTFMIEAEFQSAKRIAEHWRHPFEKRIAWLVDKLEEIAATTTESRKRHAEREERDARRRKRREERKQRAFIEAHKWDELVELADDWAEARRLRSFIDAAAKLEQTYPDTSGRVQEWISWARERIYQLDPLAGDTEDFLRRLFPPPLTEYEMMFGEPEDIDD